MDAGRKIRSGQRQQLIELTFRPVQIPACLLELLIVAVTVSSRKKELNFIAGQISDHIICFFLFSQFAKSGLIQFDGFVFLFELLIRIRHIMMDEHSAQAAPVFRNAWIDMVESLLIVFKGRPCFFLKGIQIGLEQQQIHELKSG